MNHFIFREDDICRCSYRSSHRRCSVKKVFLKISQNFEENTCARISFLIKLQAFHFIAPKYTSKPSGDCVWNCYNKLQTFKKEIMKDTINFSSRSYWKYIFLQHYSKSTQSFFIHYYCLFAVVEILVQF